MDNTLIAICGLIGSGKTEAADFFERKGFTKIRFGDVSDEELKKQGLGINVENYRMITRKLREEFGMGAFAKLNLEKIKTALESSGKVVIDGIRSYEEVVFLKKEFQQLKIIAVKVPSRLRYERLTKRTYRPLTLEEAEEREEDEKKDMNLLKTIDNADHTIANDSTLEEFKQKLESLELL